MTTELLDMFELHKAWGITTPPKPMENIDSNLFRLRMKLLLEEIVELAQASGMKQDMKMVLNNAMAQLDATSEIPYNKVKVLDALVDIQVIHCGTILTYGMHKVMDKAWREVYKSNKSKLGDDGKAIISDGTDGKPKGKILKGPNYVEPNLEKFF